MVVYCKHRGKHERPYVETAANVLFLIFTAQWYAYIVLFSMTTIKLICIFVKCLSGKDV